MTRFKSFGTLAGAVVVFIVGMSTMSHALEVFNVPSFTENKMSDSLRKTNVAKPTLVQMDPFSIVVPAGWSLEAAGVSENMNASMTATPTTDLEHDETYVGLNERRQSPADTLDERQAKLKKDKKDWATGFEMINGRKWLISRFQAEDPGTHKKMVRWAAFTISDGKEYRFLAGTPMDKSDRFSGLVEDIMKSIRIGYGPESAAADVGGQKTTTGFTDLIDDRLKNNWKVTAFKLADEAPGLWTEEDAQALVGTSVVIKDGEITIGGTKCSGTALPFTDKEAERTLLRVLKNPCDKVPSPGPVIKLSRKHCAKKISFPPYVALGDKDDIIAFGGDIAFCMVRDPKK